MRKYPEQSEQSTSNKHSITVRVSERLYQQLVAMAATEHRSVGAQVAYMADIMVNQQPWLEDDKGQYKYIVPLDVINPPKITWEHNHGTGEPLPEHMVKVWCDNQKDDGNPISETHNAMMEL